MRTSSFGIWLGGSLLIVVLALMLKEPTQGTAAFDAHTTTWGADHPTWSPDSKMLAFSLFGSIWKVPREGGVAEQLTDSHGYQAHPVWSPKGDRIAFIRGNAPAGPIPNTSGTLVVFDLSSMRETEVSLPGRVASTPAWSPDGDRIALGLILPRDTASLLHEVTLADQDVRQLQFRGAYGTVGGWINAAWNHSRDEIFFNARRGEAPQIWSMPASSAADVPIMVQFPLTRYLAEDIALIQGVTAFAEGSDVIYSANLVNGRGNFELYRISRDSKEPQPVTQTDRDELSPAVSPDGKWIAHVSNHLGNIDLFTMPVSGGEKNHVRITDLRFRRPSGRVRVRVRDALGRETRVRLHVRASDDKAYAPAGSPLFYFPVDPGKGREGFFIATGDDTFPVPAGSLRLVALKGVEYRPVEQNITVEAGTTTEIDLTMERWTDWSLQGWYTGENHFHANYNGNYYQTPRESYQWLEAMDLNVANMIVANALGAFVHDKEFFRGAPDPRSTDRYILYWGQEYRNSNPFGHMAFLNITEQVPPSYTSVIGSDSPYDFPLNTMAAIEARKQGGLVSYVHPTGFSRDIFDTRLGAKESPVTAALGAMDSMDILPYPESSTQLWYRFLNCGFQMAPGAGTDVFTNWRGINRMPGGAREYVEVGGKLDWKRWIERSARDATSSPTVKFHVNSTHGIGAGSSAQPYRASGGRRDVARPARTGGVRPERPCD